MGSDTRPTVQKPRPRRGRTASFRLKVTLIASLLAAIPLVAVGVIVEDVNARALGDANLELLSVVVDNVSGVAESVIERADTTLGLIAGQLANERLDADTRIELASASIAGSRIVSEVGIYDAQGNQIDVFRGAIASPPLPAHLPAALLAPARPAFGTVSFTEQRAFVLRAVSVRGQGQTWTLAAQVALAPLSVRVAELGLTNIPGHALFVIDSNLAVVADPSGERIGQRIDADDAGALAGVDPRAIEKGVLIAGEFRRADGEAVLGEIRTIDETPFAVVVEVTRGQAYHSLSAVRRIVLAATITAIAVAIVAGILLGRQLAKPIRSLVDYAGDLANRRFERRAPIHTGDEIGVLGDALEAAASELAASDERIRQEVAIRTDLGRYLPMKLVDQIVSRERDVALGGERRVVTVLFADVVGFTPLAEREPAEVVVTMLNELFTILTEIVFRHGGTVDKFVGDCVMAMWGAPDDQPDHARRALAAAEDMHRWLEAGNESWRERFGFVVELAIGVNTGEAVVGNFGSDTRMEYTVIGDVVNVAARLEAIARPNQILTTDATQRLAGTGFRYRALGAQVLAGKSAPVELFEVIP